MTSSEGAPVETVPQTTVSAAPAPPVEEKHKRARTHTISIGDAKRGDPFADQRRSWLSPFFGANVPEPALARDAPDPCSVLANDVHHCLDDRANSYNFCQSKVARLQLCLTEYNK